MNIVKVDIDSFRRVPAHKCQTLGSQTIRTRSIRAFVPFLASEINPVVVGYGVQATSNCCATRSGSSVGMVVCVIDIGVIVEILFETC
jgi:sensor histidine kinase regulating citrate/malate metabolism